MDDMRFTIAPADLSKDDFMAKYGGIYEHAPWVAAKLFGAGLGPQDSRLSIFAGRMADIVDAAGHDAQMALLRAHPELAGKLIGSAQRVPVPSGSITILDATLKDDTETVSVEGINEAMKKAADESFGYTDEELVSSDIIGISYGSLFDATQTLAQRCGTKIYEVRVVSWYDNEMSYVNQLIRTLNHMGNLMQ